MSALRNNKLFPIWAILFSPILANQGGSYLSLFFAVFILFLYIEQLNNPIILFLISLPIVFSLAKNLVVLEPEFYDAKMILGVYRILILYLIYEYILKIEYTDKIDKILYLFTALNSLLVFETYFGAGHLWSILKYYAEGEVYTLGYSKFRAFGMSGQPGKFGLLFALNSFVLAQRIKQTNYKIIHVTCLILCITMVILSLSRISYLTLFFLLALSWSTQLGYIKTLLFSFASILLLFQFLNKEFYTQIMRGIDFNNLTLGTGNFRFALKQWALSEMKNPLDLIFGISTSESYLLSLNNPKHLFGYELNLKDADGSGTIQLVRYGLFGLIIYSITYVKMIIDFLKPLNTQGVIFLLLTIGLIQIDPLLDDNKLVLMTLLSAKVIK